MSFATLRLHAGQNWRKDALLSLSGIYMTKRQDLVPFALSRFLQDYPRIQTLHLHLDNDEVGRCAVQGITDGLQGRCEVLDQPPHHGKDVNDLLCQKLGLCRQHREMERM